MTTIAEAVKAADIRTDKLFQAGQSIESAECLPREAKDSLLAALSAARIKYPQKDGPADQGGAYPDTRPSTLRAAAGKVAAGMKDGK